jgi:phenylacetate-coenzyme A ligase PaaK-like adenylate-forming protein
MNGTQSPDNLQSGQITIANMEHVLDVYKFPYHRKQKFKKKLNFKQIAV